MKPLASLTAVLALALGSCSLTRQAGPTPEELAAADYGPAPIAFENRVRRFVRAEYQQYQVVEVEVGEPRKGWFGTLGGLIVPRDIRYGWAVKFRGYRIGFTGMKPIVVGEVFFRDDKLEGIADGAEGFRFAGADRQW